MSRLKLCQVLCGDGAEPVLSKAEGTRPTQTQVDNGCFGTPWLLELLL